MARAPEWDHVGWHYGLLHAAAPAHNRLLLRSRGTEHIPPEGGCVLAANHTSWWDPVILRGLTRRPVYLLAKSELLSSRFNRWFFFEKGGCIPIDRDTRNPQALAAATAALQEGRIIGLFPEGTRHVGDLGPAKTGVARLAMSADVPVIPIAVLTDRFWPPGRRLPDLREPVYIRVGEPMRLAGDARAETERVMDRIRVLLDEARKARDAGERWSLP